MSEKGSSFYLRAGLIALEVVLISLLSYAMEHYHPIEMARFISLDVLYCLPVIQTAHLTALHTSRRYDTQISNIAGISVALIWSLTELAITWPYFPVAAFILNTFTRSIAFTLIIRVIIKLWREREYANKDQLTGLANRAELIERLQAEQRRSERTRSPYSLLSIDIDDFKRLNAEMGHQAGDEALKTFADILQSSSRKVDVAARMGGDEFVMLLPDTDKPSCYTLIKRIESTTKQTFRKQDWGISVSIGQTTHVGNTPDLSVALRLAEENRFEMKRMKQQIIGTSRAQ